MIYSGYGYGGGDFMNKERNYSYTPSSPTSIELFVTLAQARTYLKLSDIDISDADLTAMILAVSRGTERYTRLTLYATAYKTSRDYFNFMEMRLKRAPLQSVESVK